MSTTGAAEIGNFDNSKKLRKNALKVLKKAKETEAKKIKKGAYYQKYGAKTYRLV